MCSICNDPKHDDLNDSLDDIFGTPSDVADIAFATDALRNAVADPAKGIAVYTEPCPSCNGSGRFYSYTGRLVGNCFKCKGSGVVTFKTSPEQRAKAASDREAVKAKQAAAVGAAVASWASANPDEMAWMVAATERGFGFASEMLVALSKYGRLTEKQMATVQRLLVQDQLRAQEKVEIAERAPDITGDALTKITDSFAHAIERGIKYPKMRLDEYVFSLVRSGANSGAIYVKTIERDDDGERTYLGKIMDGRFVRSMKCSPEMQERIIAAAMDPEAAAKAYGHRTGTCSICGRKLTNGVSIDLGIGPICASKYGF